MEMLVLVVVNIKITPFTNRKPLKNNLKKIQTRLLIAIQRNVINNKLSCNIIYLSW